MENYSILVEFIKYTGGAGVIALIWWFYHKSMTEHLSKIFDQQRERDKENSENLNQIIKQQSDWQDKNFNLLKDMISTNLLQSETLQEIKTKIDNNQWCPFLRNFVKGKSFTITQEEGVENE